MKRKESNKPDLIISSKVTLLRNFKDYLFPPMLDFETSKFISDEVVKLFEDDKKFKVYDLDSAVETNANMLYTNGLISKDYPKAFLKKTVIVSKDLTTSIAINAENHVEITVITEGDSLDKAYEKAMKISDIVENNFNIAFSEENGYQTTNISDLGLGLKAEYTIHIPLLDISNQTMNLKSIISKLGYQLTPAYTENATSSGGLYKISTINTFNQSAEECFNLIRKMAMQITEREQILREEMLSKEFERMEDEVLRAYGILTNARLISEKEATILLSYLKLGMQLNLLPNKNLENKDPIKILKDVLDGNFKYKNKKKMQQLELDVKRANYIKEILLI